MEEMQIYCRANASWVRVTLNTRGISTRGAEG